MFLLIYTFNQFHTTTFNSHASMNTISTYYCLQYNVIEQINKQTVTPTNLSGAQFVQVR